jgi:hypothetical protein
MGRDCGNWTNTGASQLDFGVVTAMPVYKRYCATTMGRLTEDFELQQAVEEWHGFTHGTQTAPVQR